MKPNKMKDWMRRFKDAHEYGKARHKAKLAFRKQRRMSR